MWHCVLLCCDFGKFTLSAHRYVHTHIAIVCPCAEMYTNSSFHLDLIFEESVFWALHCSSFMDCRHKAQNPQVILEKHQSSRPYPSLCLSWSGMLKSEVAMQHLPRRRLRSERISGRVSLHLGSRMKREFIQMCFTGVLPPGNRRSLGVSSESLFHVGVGLEAEALKIWPGRPIFKVWFLLLQMEFCDPS